MVYFQLIFCSPFLAKLMTYGICWCLLQICNLCNSNKCLLCIQSLVSKNLEPILHAPAGFIDKLMKWEHFTQAISVKSIILCMIVFFLSWDFDLLYLQYSSLTQVHYCFYATGLATLLIYISQWPSYRCLRH